MASKTKFRIQFVRSGVDFGYEYRSSIAGAIKLATSKEWFGPGDSMSWDLKPAKAIICVKADDRYEAWERVAECSAEGVDIRDWRDRVSVKNFLEEIDALQAKIDHARDMHDEAVKIAKEIPSTSPAKKGE